jgi:predicted ATP-dependent endonuclease of OLD family
MLRYHAKLKIQKELQTRPVLVAFEEPELFLHPSAANLLRDTIYSLGISDQIICTTHSPWMIDLRQEPQSVTKMNLNG